MRIKDELAAQSIFEYFERDPDPGVKRSIALDGLSQRKQ
jgi:hypothetical protein